MTKLSRTRLELSLECPRCFWLLMNKGVSRPAPAPYTINSAIDALLKKEFDSYRAAGAAHPLMQRFGIAAVPFAHEKLDDWRNNFKGVRHEHAASGFLVYGAVDDVWSLASKELAVVDYKATGANEHRIYDQYRRQMEVYQWLLEMNGFAVSRTGYFLFARVNKGAGFQGGNLAFDLFLEPLQGDRSWVQQALVNARAILDGPLPQPGKDCGYCAYVRSAQTPSGLTDVSRIDAA
jgi:CRISPR/Cas system-associated exonuclease Cas4 (RecB family)